MSTVFRNVAKFLDTFLSIAILSNLWRGRQHECQQQQERQRQQESQKEKPANVETPAIAGMSATADASSSRNASKQQECRNSTDPSKSVEASKRWAPARAGNSSNTQEGPHKKESLRNQTPRQPRNAATSGMPASAG